jgi:hypothetical protein
MWGRRQRLPSAPAGVDQLEVAAYGVAVRAHWNFKLES